MYWTSGQKKQFEYVTLVLVKVPKVLKQSIKMKTINQKDLNLNGHCGN